ELDVKVRFGRTWEVLQSVVLTDRLRDGMVDMVVPAGRRFLQRQVTLLLEGQEIAVADDVLHDLVVPTKPAAFEPSLRTCAVQLRDVEEGRVLGRFQKCLG